MAPEGGGDGDLGGKEAARAELSAGWWRSLRGVLSRAPSPAVKTAAAAAATAAGGSVVARWPRGAALGGRHCSFSVAFLKKEGSWCKLLFPVRGLKAWQNGC